MSLETIDDVIASLTFSTACARTRSTAFAGRAFLFSLTRHLSGPVACSTDYMYVPSFAFGHGACPM